MVKYENWWCDLGDRGKQQENVQDFWFARFFERACQDWNISHDLINVVSVFADRVLKPRSSNETVRIFYSGENLYSQFHNIPPHYTNRSYVEPQVDLILAFSFSSIKFFYFPLWLMYWNFWSDGLFKPVQNQARNNHAILIASHTANGVRPQLCSYVKQQNIQVHINKSHLYSNPDQVVDVPSGNEGKRKVLQAYKYNICPENSISDGYTTEKFFESLAAGCIPIYAGAPFKLDVINEEYYIDVTKQPLTPELLTAVKQPDENIWKPDAFAKIFMMHAILWVHVWKRLMAKHKCQLRVDNILLTEYKVASEDEGMQKLLDHWHTHQHLFEPRARFNINDKIVEWEQLVAQLYL
jgi:hypothetical protein